MALYSTFFFCQPEQLARGFPGWRPPLPKPVRRQVNNPFTGEIMTIETRAPEWPEEEEDQAQPLEYGVVAMKGRYEDYLEDRLPEFVRTQPHWCSKGLMNIELDALGEALNVKPVVEDALFAPPSAGGAHVWQIRSELVAALVALDDRRLKASAEGWAQVMSGPEYTQNSEGETIADGWEAGDALQILKPLVKLARQAAAGQLMYLLIEP